jgi:hypothetical protein
MQHREFLQFLDLANDRGVISDEAPNIMGDHGEEKNPIIKDAFLDSDVGDCPSGLRRFYNLDKSILS